MQIQPGQIIEIPKGYTVSSPNTEIIESLVCQWPSDLPIKTSHWNLVYNHFKQHGQFLSAEDVRSIIGSND